MLNELVAHMHKDREAESPTFATVRFKIALVSHRTLHIMTLSREFTQFDIGAEGTIEVQRGFLNVVWGCSRP